MTYCPECEEWVETDEGRCVQCDKLLKSKSKKLIEDEDGFEDDLIIEEENAIPDSESGSSLEDIPSTTKGRKRRS